jgi:uncharacterized membrane protein YfcA
MRGWGMNFMLTTLIGFFVMYKGGFPTMTIYIFLGAIFLAAGFTQGVSGFGAALVAMPLLTMFLDVKVAVPLCMLNGLLITLYLSWQLKKHMDWRKIRPLFFGCVPGIIIGVFLLNRINSELLKILLGCLIIMYSLYRLMWDPVVGNLKERWAYMAGFFSGVIGAAFSAGGPPTIIYVSLTGWKKDEIKATLSMFFFSTGVLMSTGHAISGLINSLVLSYFASSCLFTIVGVYIGSLCYNRIRQEVYIKIILILLLLLGGMMIYSAVISQ